MLKISAFSTVNNLLAVIEHILSSYYSLQRLINAIYFGSVKVMSQTTDARHFLTVVPGFDPELFIQVFEKKMCFSALGYDQDQEDYFN